MPLHLLCHKGNVDERAALEAARALIDQCPESITHATDGGFLPVHVACMSRSPEFCRLIKAYPGSARITDRDGLLPLHYACLMNNVATVEYIYKLYPDAIHNAMTAGFYPIHIAVDGVRHRSNPTTAVDIVQFLLDCDPDVKLQKVRGRLSLLHVACEREYIDSNIEAGIQVIEVIYDAYPEAIENNEISSDIRRYHQQVQTFINSQLVYSRQAKDHRLMTTPNEKGQLPLHTALQSNVRLGSIMLLVKGNPSASVIRTLDSNFALPLHLACQHHESAGVVQYLLGLDATTLRAVDFGNNTALHYACRGAKYETITLLLDEYNAVSVSNRNAQNQLPIDLLLESNEVLDRESVEYTKSIFRLLRAYPETVMNIGIQKLEHASAAFPSPNGKKRKLGNEE